MGRVRLRQAMGPPETLWWLATAVSFCGLLAVILRPQGMWQHPWGQAGLASLAGVFNLQPAWLGGTTLREGLLHFAQSGLLALPIAFLIVRPFGMESYRILSPSMEPALHGSQDWVLVNKGVYWFRPPRRQEIIVFTAPAQARTQEQTLIKRVIGLPGETVYVRRGQVWIRKAEGDWEALNEPYLSQPPAYRLVHQIPQGAFFVLGDNRNRSYDSHVWGSVPRELVRGRAGLIFWPPWRIRLLR